eukprot:CAMPEP_0114621822 /NCGR_PEP_ID=MMETSP0168-20121206/9423_1 /TAXON_ID=95228 ORGANISM="Vannella sp., Strain DIVA3 517/6/12" /NCGR_SAMPLE_ID=MMETSP0168 /ASSEMBLY_ACC=CAM_ASM_000044 /LENGTH=189 /DNA_ID=CAMNT_0001833025 /DNA_START=44 /DNA_END=613 /DNA_ORIENTATION=+
MEEWEGEAPRTAEEFVSRYNAVVHENRRLMALACKYRRIAARLSVEKRCLVEKLLMERVEPAVGGARARPSATTRKGLPRASVCSYLRKGGVRCRSKAIIGTEHCWHHRPEQAVCKYVGEDGAKCTATVGKQWDADGVGLCTDHGHKVSNMPNGAEEVKKYKLDAAEAGADGKAVTAAAEAAEEPAPAQ